MTCHNCGILTSKFGFFGRERIQRYRCKQCGKTFADIPERPLDSLRIPLDKAVQIVSLLVEGVGIRAIERLTQTHRDTVMSVLEVVGRKCAVMLDTRVVNHPFPSVQVDEMFCFVKCKERLNVNQEREIGDQYVFLGIDSKSKFIINHAIGKRDSVTTQQYIRDLKKRVQVPFQLTTDGFQPYLNEVFYTFFNQAHFAQVIKQYANFTDSKVGERRYSPSQCIGTRIRIHIGNPDRGLISTSYVERTNLSVRLFNRRFTRLTLGYSKKLANLKHSVALLIAHFNFCRIHSTIKTTPAMACGLADRQWTVEQLITSTT